jgi:SAM-dependent methyltransferase
MGYMPRQGLLNAPASPATSVRWEEPACALCGGRRTQTVLAAQELRAGSGLWFAVVECVDCGLCFTNPRPAQESRHRFHIPQSRVPGAWSMREKLKRFRLRRTHSLLPWRGQGRLLDVGGSDPTFLLRMKAAGWQVTALVDEHTDPFALGPGPQGTLLAGVLPESTLPSESFDAITLFQTLESAADPAATLRDARRLIVPGGKLVIETPNIDSLAYRLFGEHWHGLDLPRHLTHFTPWTLNLLLEQAGFRTDRVRMCCNGSWIRRSARAAVKGQRRGLLRRLMRTHLFSGATALFGWLTGQSDLMVVTATPARRHAS